MSGQTNRSGVTGEQIRLLETQLASAFNEEVKLAYANSGEISDVYCAPVRVPGVFFYAIKYAYIGVAFCRAYDDPAVMTAVICFSYKHHYGSNSFKLGRALLMPGKTVWELAWEKDEH
jgi:hypothetical protein